MPTAIKRLRGTAFKQLNMCSLINKIMGLKLVIDVIQNKVDKKDSRLRKHETSTTNKAACTFEDWK